MQKIEDARFITRRQEYIKIHVRVKLCNKNCIVYLQTLLTSHIDYCAFVVCCSQIPCNLEGLFNFVDFNYVFGKAARPLISYIKSAINKILFMRIKSTVYKGFKLRLAKLHVILYLCDNCQFIFYNPKSASQNFYLDSFVACTVQFLCRLL